MTENPRRRPTSRAANTRIDLPRLLDVSASVTITKHQWAGQWHELRESYDSRYDMGLFPSGLNDFPLANQLIKTAAAVAFQIQCGVGVSQRFERGGHFAESIVLKELRHFL